MGGSSVGEARARGVARALARLALLVAPVTVGALGAWCARGPDARLAAPSASPPRAGAEARGAGSEASTLPGAVLDASSALASLDASAPERLASATPQAAASNALASADASAGGEPSPSAPSDPRCPGDMVAVEGNYCTDVYQQCDEWGNDDRHRCLRFREPSRCTGRRRALSFCMDRYEWPNQQGGRPAVWVTFDEAEAQCRSRGRRLCTQDEWTFACEGEQMLPYPYGYTRDPGACTVDHVARAPDRRLLHSTRPGVALAEVERVYEAAPSGSASRCRSAFGAYDLVGSVDEWTVNEAGVPFRSALKGGWWGRIRGRCRPATLSHNERFRYYQIGFRCCAELSSPR